jgi:hypothetical protein
MNYVVNNLNYNILPLSIDDDVYLESEELRQEYVLNYVGLIYRGSASNGAYAWDYCITLGVWSGNGTKRVWKHPQF